MKITNNKFRRAIQLAVIAGLMSSTALVYAKTETLSGRLSSDTDTIGDALAVKLTKLVPNTNLPDGLDFSSIQFQGMQLRKAVSEFVWWSMLGELQGMNTPAATFLANHFQRMDLSVWKDQFGIHFMTGAEQVAFGKTTKGAAALAQINAIQAATQKQIIHFASQGSWAADRINTAAEFFWVVAARKELATTRDSKVRSLLRGQIDAFEAFKSELEKAIKAHLRNVIGAVTPSRSEYDHMNTPIESRPPQPPKADEGLKGLQIEETEEGIVSVIRLDRCAPVAITVG